MQDKAENQPLQLVYDGECPFCTRYVKLLRLRETVGELELISARSQHPLVAEVLQQGFVIDDGMVLKMQGRYYHGDDCLHVLAMMSSQQGWFNRTNFWLFRSAWLSRVAYPVLRAGRNLALRLLGRSKLGF